MPTPTPRAACVNCGSEILDRFCGGCGQRVPGPDDYSRRELVRAAVGWFTNYDSRLLRTLRTLFLRPGQLAVDHFEGRRGRHLDPFRIFLLANVFAWFVTPHSFMRGFSIAAARMWTLFPHLWERALAGRAALAHVPLEEMARRFDAGAPSQNSLTVLCMPPLLALALTLLLAGRGWRFGQHLVFVAHFYCIHLLCVLLYIGFLLKPLYVTLDAHPSTKPVAAIVRNIWTEHFILAPALFAYLFYGMRRAYALTTLEAAWRALLLTGWACLIARAFFDIAFLLSLALA